MILKNERMADAFGRILKRETNFDAGIGDARLLGAYEHFYDMNRFGDPAFGTHYVTLGYELEIGDTGALQADLQHGELIWWAERRPDGVGTGARQHQSVFSLDVALTESRSGEENAAPRCSSPMIKRNGIFLC